MIFPVFVAIVIVSAVGLFAVVRERKAAAAEDDAQPTLPDVTWRRWG